MLVRSLLAWVGRKYVPGGVMTQAIADKLVAGYKGPGKLAFEYGDSLWLEVEIDMGRKPVVVVENGREVARLEG